MKIRGGPRPLPAPAADAHTHLKGTLHQEPRTKSEDLFMEKYLFRKNAIFSENFSPISCENFVPGPHLALITTCLLTSIITSKNCMVGESWNVFTI